MLLLRAEGPISRDGIHDSAPISNAQAEDYLKTLEEHRLLRYTPESRTYSLTRSGRNCARLYAELLKVISTANLAIAGGIPVDENRGVTYAHTPD
jgi:DNA-binding IclR family transcriptional regulator